MSRPAYPTDAEWIVLGPLIPLPKPGGRPLRHARRELVNAIRYVLRAVVHPANIPDQTGARTLLEAVPADFPDLRQIWADTGYRGRLRDWAEQRFGVTLTVVQRPRRWVRLPSDQEHPPVPTGSPCCHGGGLWNGPSPGWGGTAA
jgi:hypothetical protein